MSFDPLNPFANGPFILPVNAPGQIASLDIPGSYESAITIPPYGVIRFTVDKTANPADTLEALFAQGKVTFQGITLNVTTGDDVYTPITNPADINTIIADLNGGVPQTLIQLTTFPRIPQLPSGFVNGPGLIPIFTPDMVTEANSHTLQRLLEVNYIREANRLLTNALSSLSGALSNANNILNTLTTLQDLHNKLTVKTPPPLDFDYLSSYGSIAGYLSAYSKAASAYFGQPISPEFLWSSAGAIVSGMPGGGTFAYYASQLQKAKTQLGAYLVTLLPLTKKLSGTNDPDPNSLYAKAKIVYDNLPGTSAVPPTFTEAQNWALDNYNAAESNLSAAAEGGILQQQITSAITAGESLNDTLKEKVRNYLFVFEEYQKSASAMLTKISDIITKFAQGIRPA